MTNKTDSAALIALDADELERLLSEATPAPWAYRPEEHDDWGVVKGPVYRPDGFEYDMRFPIGRFRRNTTQEQESEARREKSDPWRADAELTVWLRNNAHVILSAIRGEHETRLAGERAGMERAAEIAEWGHMVPPDGGSPSEEECNLAASIAQAIRAQAGEPT